MAEVQNNFVVEGEDPLPIEKRLQGIGDFSFGVGKRGGKVEDKLIRLGDAKKIWEAQRRNMVAFLSAFDAMPDVGIGDPLGIVNLSLLGIDRDGVIELTKAYLETWHGFSFRLGFFGDYQRYADETEVWLDTLKLTSTKKRVSGIFLPGVRRSPRNRNAQFMKLRVPHS